ncbi:unknown [Sinorhizobium phage PBC5]|uniref:DNA methyltransferase n=1 Tax=Sinorhizobium phage PBC5 TaxID=179237 RepID=UPI000009B6AE|nr:DNA methyltransferase [Sinorhizobium phage PBC5]AAL49606.1 unknown [Sinorhizobium phage PBC5]
MSPDLDLNKRVWTFRRLGVTAIGTWLRVEGRFRPCMVLIPADREYDDRLIPCVITIDRAWIWSEEVGDPAQAAATAFQFATSLGLSAYDKRTVMRLAMFIADHLGDLLSIPPYQNSDEETVAEVTMIDALTGKVTEAVVKE